MTTTKTTAIMCCDKSSSQSPVTHIGTKCSNVLLAFLESHSFLRRHSSIKTTSEAHKRLIVKGHVPDLLSLKGLTSQWWQVRQYVAARACRRVVTRLRRARNNGLFFPGSLLHPHHCPPIGPKLFTKTGSCDKQEWHVQPIRGPGTEVTHFQSHFLWWNQCLHFFFWTEKRHFTEIQKSQWEQWTEDF